MFAESSRYFLESTVDASAQGGRPVKAVVLRRPPAVPGNLVVAKGNVRLDLIAARQYNQPTWFWHIADANTELIANDLVAEIGREIKVPDR